MYNKAQVMVVMILRKSTDSFLTCVVQKAHGANLHLHLYPTVVLHLTKTLSPEVGKHARPSPTGRGGEVVPPLVRLEEHGAIGRPRGHLFYSGREVGYEPQNTYAAATHKVCSVCTTYKLLLKLGM